MLRGSRGRGPAARKHSEKEWVVEFTTFAGDREFRTVELLTLERPSVIHYRWLEGPRPEVCETVRFVALDHNTTRLAYSGTFSVGRGCSAR